VHGKLKFAKIIEIILRCHVTWIGFCESEYANGIGGRGKREEERGMKMKLWAVE